jgi:hypothetical protein
MRRKKCFEFFGNLCSEQSCRSQIGNLSTTSFDPVQHREKSDDRLTSSHISLEKSLHTNISLHIFEYFKESDFLMTGESKGEL